MFWLSVLALTYAGLLYYKYQESLEAENERVQQEKTAAQ